MIRWPENKQFAFTIFDDPDGQTLEENRAVYSFLADLGFRTTMGVWPLGPRRKPNSKGETCANRSYLAHVQAMQASGFEIGIHNATLHSATREETSEALELFKNYFGSYPVCMANHYNEEAIYWGPARVSGNRRLIYNLATLGRKIGKHFGEAEGHRAFWGDLCREKIRYCRNFVFSDINTLRACPFMPYHDPQRQFVGAWYSATEGANRRSYVKALTEANQDRLAAEGGACIMYTHFGHGFLDDAGRMDGTFRTQMQRLSKMNGWFVPLKTLLDFLEGQQGKCTLTDEQRSWLERRWLREKLFRGTS